MTVTTDSMVSIQRIQTTFDQLAGRASATTTSTSTSQELFAKLIAALQAQDEANQASTTTATGAGIVAAAGKYEGVPYVFGGTSSSGIDCTGLVQKALGDAGITVGRSMDEQMTAGTEVGKLADAKPGDLIVLDGGAHIVIYSGNGNVIHAPFEGRTVTEQKIWFDDSDIATIRRVAPDAPAKSTTAMSTSDALQALINAQAAILTRSIS
ncbi:MAG: C40 family peptidase [Salinibacterium sp.]|nr:C40 family peptidase [Salinibacterium sp.]